MHHNVETLLSLLVIATMVAMLVRYINLPYTVMLVLGGLVLGLLHYLPEVRMTPEIVMMIFLPVLLFEASINIEYSHLKADLPSILTFAGPGVLIALLVTATCMHFGVGFPWPVALLFGAMIVATDPVSVLAIFKKLGVPPRLTAVVEGESLFNDGTAIVAFQIVLAVVLTGHFSVFESVQKFLLICLGGLAVGLVIGYAAIALLEKIDDHLLELMITTVLAYGTYLIAESLHVSGVIAVVTAGIMVGNLGWERAMSPTTRVAVATFWEFAAFVCNSLIFLLIGLQIHLGELREFAPMIGVGILALFAGRMLAIYPLAALMNGAFKAGLPWKWTHILVWGNLKGALSMALVMSLPADLPYRRELLVTLFGVVLFSLLIPGTSMGGLLKLLHIGKPDESVTRFEELQGKLLGLRASLRELELLFAQGRMPSGLFDEQKHRLELLSTGVEQELSTLKEAHPELGQRQSGLIFRHLLATQKSAYKEAFRSGLLSESTAQSLIRQTNEELEGLEHES
ncbi:MAG: Na+/H+ antiporter [Candidatus Sericytochromatia bacterium]